MDIFTVLSSKPHSERFLNRYIKFIEYCQSLPSDRDDQFARHHICPKSKDMFPEYSSFKTNQWNKISLTPREHNIAHYLLWKTYRNSSISNAFWRMQKNRDNRLFSRVYAQLCTEKSEYQSKLMKTMWESNESFKENSLAAAIRTNKKRTESGEASALMKRLWKDTDFREKQRKHREENYDSVKEHNRVQKMWDEAPPERRDLQRQVVAESRKKSEKICPHCGFSGPNIFGNMTKHISKCNGRGPTLPLL